MKTKQTAVLLLASVLTGCAATVIQHYEGKRMEPSNEAVLAAVVYYREEKLSFQIQRIDGKRVNTDTAAGFYMLPGTYTLTVNVTYNTQISGGRISSKTAVVESEATLQAGHTYIPAGSTDGDTVSLYLLDKGMGYPEDCLPLFQLDMHASIHDSRRSTPAGGC